MRVAPALALTDEQRRTLERWSRGRSLPKRQVERALIILLAAEGKQDLEIAAEVGISNQKAARWRKRFLNKGLAGLEKDAPRPGRTPSIPKATADRVVELNDNGQAAKCHALGPREPWLQRSASARPVCGAFGMLTA